MLRQHVRRFVNEYLNNLLGSIPDQSMGSLSTSFKKLIYNKNKPKAYIYIVKKYCLNSDRQNEKRISEKTQKKFCNRNKVRIKMLNCF